MGWWIRQIPDANKAYFVLKKELHMIAKKL